MQLELGRGRGTGFPLITQSRFMGDKTGFSLSSSSLFDYILGLKFERFDYLRGEKKSLQTIIGSLPGVNWVTDTEN